MVSEPPVFVIDLPNNFMVFKNNKTGESYSLHGLNHNVSMEGDSLFLFYNGLNMENSFYGWYQKDDKGGFVDVFSNELLFHEHNRLYSSPDNVVMTVIKPILVYNNVRVSDDLSPNFLYKLDKTTDALSLSSKNKTDIFSAKNGFYYVPYPGTSVKSVFLIEDICRKILLNSGISKICLMD
jgi:hypothetical protein